MWHPDDDVSSAHPTGNWARGRDQVKTVYQVLVDLDSPKLAGSRRAAARRA